LANKKSAIKRIRQTEKRTERNRWFRGRARTFVKKARTAIEEGGVEEAQAATLAAVSVLDKAAEKGIIHKNNAARRKSRLMKHLAKIGTDGAKSSAAKKAAPKKKAAAKKAAVKKAATKKAATKKTATKKTATKKTATKKAATKK
jgi:small subunit ribosomal protein S20